MEPGDGNPKESILEGKSCTAPQRSRTLGLVPEGGRMSLREQPMQWGKKVGHGALPGWGSTGDGLSGGGRERKGSHPWC